MDQNIMPKISVIMPVYNSKQFLRMAVDSVLNQTFKDFELILVDDGSKDGSGAVCDEYAQIDARVKVIHQENGGICSARNTGMKAAVGEYLAFIDNDDEYLPNLLEENYTLAKEHDADVVKYGYRVEETFTGGFVDNRQQVAKQFTVITLESLAKHYIECRNSGAFNMIWNGLYKQAFLKEKKLVFNEQCKLGYEDWIFNSLLYSQISKMILNPSVEYVHYQREGFSTSKKYNDNQLYACVLASEAEQDMLDAIEIEKVVPLQKEENLIANIVEILVRLDNPNCPYSVKEKAEKLLQIREEKFYQTRLTEETLEKLQSFSRTKYTVAKLFYYKKMTRLVYLSKIYLFYMSNKKIRMQKSK